MADNKIRAGGINDISVVEFGRLKAPLFQSAGMSWPEPASSWLPQHGRAPAAPCLLLHAHTRGTTTSNVDKERNGDIRKEDVTKIWKQASTVITMKPDRQECFMLDRAARLDSKMNSTHSIFIFFFTTALSITKAFMAQFFF